jgi:outer membrane protein assembly factor BamB
LLTHGFFNTNKSMKEVGKMKIITKIVIQIALGVILMSSSVWVSVTAASALESKGVLSDTPYPVFGLDTHHTNRSIFKGPAIKPEIEWIASISGSDRMGHAEMPLSIGPDETVYLGIRGVLEGLYAFTSDGILKWSWTRPISQGVSGTAAIVNGGHLYINFGTHWPPADYGIAKLNQSDGNEVWTVQSNEAAYMSSPAVDQSGNIYFGAFDCTFRSVDSDGNLNWIHSAGSYPDGIIFTSAAIGNDGTVYIGNGEYGAIALNPDGTVKWTAPLSDRPRFGPNILSSGVIVYRSQDGTVTAFDGDGQQLWSKSFSLVDGDATGAVAPNGTTLYIKTRASSSDKLVALDGNTGSIQWEFDLSLQSRNDAPIVGSDGIIYVSDGSNLLAINDDGLELWNFSLDLGEPDHNYEVSWPVIGGEGIIYVNLYEYWPSPRENAKMYIVRLSEPINQPPPQIEIDFKYLEVESKVEINFSQTLKVNAVFEPGQTDGIYPWIDGVVIEYVGGFNPFGIEEPCFLFFFRPVVFDPGEENIYKFKFDGGADNIAFYAWDPETQETIDLTDLIVSVRGILDMTGQREPCFLKFTVIAESNNPIFNHLAGPSAIRLVFPDSNGKTDGGLSSLHNVSGIYEPGQPD